MALGQFAQRIRFPSQIFERRHRLAEPRNEIGGGGKFAVGQIGARIGMMQIDRLLATIFAELFAKIRQRQCKSSTACARPWAAQDRALERGDGSCARPSRSSGCLSKARSVTGGAPSSAAAAASRAKIPAGVSASASPPESSAAMFQRASAASTRRPSARSGVTSAAVLPSCTRLAQHHRDGKRLFLRIARLRSSPWWRALRRVGFEVSIGGLSAPQISRGGGAERFRDQPLAPARCRQAALRRRALRRCARARRAWRIADGPAPA